MNPITLVYKLTNFLLSLATNRPLCLIAAGLGIRDFFVGLGFIFNFSDVTQTLLYQNFTGLLHGPADGIIAGVLFIIFGLFVMVTALMNKPRPAAVGLRFQSLVWMFSAIMFFINGQFLLAIVTGLFFSIAAGYLAFFFRYGPELKVQKRRIEEVVEQHQLEGSKERRLDRKL
jgi:hypothetical protein